MDTSNLKFVLLVVTLNLGSASYAQIPSGDTPFAIECEDDGVLDFKNGEFTCRNVVITQGDFVLSAGGARLTSLDFVQGTWTFTRQVTMKGNNTEVTADKAVVKIANKQLQNVRVVGQPATFEQLMNGSEDAAKGRANTINYDLEKDVVTLTENAFLSQGDDQITGEIITYDVQQERVIANSNGTEGRVRILITPTKDQEPEQP